MKHSLRKYSFENIQTKRPKFGICEGVYFLVKLRSKVAIPIIQNKF